jgi:WD40 repeat protein
VIDPTGARLWHIESGAVLYTTSASYNLFSPDGRYVASNLLMVNNAAVFQVDFAVSDLSSSKRLFSKMSGGPLVFSRDGQMLAYSDYDAKGQPFTAVVNLASGAEFVLLRSARAVLSPNWSFLASEADDIELYSITHRDLHFTLPGKRVVKFSDDDSLLVTEDESGMLRLWYCPTGQEIAEFPARGSILPAFSPDCRVFRWIETGGKHPVFNLWHIEKGEKITRIELHSDFPLTGFSPDAQHFCVRHSMARTALWRTDDGTLHTSLDVRDTTAFAFSPDSTLLATASDSGDIYLCSTDSGELLEMYQEHKGCILKLAFNAEGTRLASADHTGVTHIWGVG